MGCRPCFRFKSSFHHQLVMPKVSSNTPPESSIMPAMCMSAWHFFRTKTCALRRVMWSPKLVLGAFYSSCKDSEWALELDFAFPLYGQAPRSGKSPKIRELQNSPAWPHPWKTRCFWESRPNWGLFLVLKFVRSRVLGRDFFDRSQSP